MNATTKLARVLARVSRANCPRLAISVFHDGGLLFGVSENENLAQGDGHGGWTYRIGCITQPMTVAQTTEWLAERLAQREARLALPSVYDDN